MKQENTNKNKQLYILIAASIIVSITPLLIFVFMHRLSNITPYIAGRIAAGIIVGSAMLTIIPLIVDWCVRGFKRKPKRWRLIWLVFLLILIPQSRTNDLKIAQFSSACISKIQEKASLIPEGHNLALKFEDRCYSAGEAFVDCLNKKGSIVKACFIKAIDIFEAL